MYPSSVLYNLFCVEACRKPRIQVFLRRGSGYNVLRQCKIVCFQVNALGFCQIQFLCIHVAACGSVHDVEIILDLCQMFTIL